MLLFVDGLCTLAALGPCECHEHFVPSQPHPQPPSRVAVIVSVVFSIFEFIWKKCIKVLTANEQHKNYTIIRCVGCCLGAPCTPCGLRSLWALAQAP